MLAHGCEQLRRVWCLGVGVEERERQGHKQQRVEVEGVGRADCGLKGEPRRRSEGIE